MTTEWLYSLLLLQIALVPKRYQGQVNQWANLHLGELEVVNYWLVSYLLQNDVNGLPQQVCLA